jgi:hypothetical protein
VTIFRSIVLFSSIFGTFAAHGSETLSVDSVLAEQSKVQQKVAEFVVDQLSQGRKMGSDCVVQKAWIDSGKLLIRFQRSETFWTIFIDVSNLVMTQATLNESLGVMYNSVSWNDAYFSSLRRIKFYKNGLIRGYVTAKRYDSFAWDSFNCQ